MAGLRGCRIFGEAREKNALPARDQKSVGCKITRQVY